MARVAVVTGGTRGIGAAIAKALNGAGYKVAANYGGNDEVAAKFKAETGVNVYKWDVSSYEACVAGLTQVAADLGPVEVLVNNAGITRDSMFHRMKPEQWLAVINTNLVSLFNMCRPVIEGMRERKFGRIINISSINGQKGQLGCHLSGLHQHRHGQGHVEGCAGEIGPAADPDRPPGRAGGGRSLRPVPRLRRRRPHHRLDPDRQWRAVHGMMWWRPHKS